MKPKKETTLVNNIKKHLNTLEKSFFFKIHGGPMQMAGISDLIGVHNGKFVAIEVKTPCNKKGTTQLQDWFIEKVNRAGGVGFVATSIDDINKNLIDCNNIV